MLTKAIMMVMNRDDESVDDSDDDFTVIIIFYLIMMILKNVVKIMAMTLMIRMIMRFTIHLTFAVSQCLLS